MQTLQQDLDPAPRDLTAATHPVLRELMADPVTAYVEEVRLLRQRVALLEAELAATKAAQVTTAAAPSVAASSNFAARPVSPSVAPSEFTECMTPAVRAVDPSQPAAVPTQTEPAQTPAADRQVHEVSSIDNSVVLDDITAPCEPVPNPGFAQAWSAEEAEASFEERVAERAFFQHTTVDEESRTWLLAK